jgi:hypothetical protein
MVEVHDGTCLFARFNWDGTAVQQNLPYHPYMTFKDIHITPSAQWPTGQKGLALARYWETQECRLSPPLGIILLDGDVVIDPSDLRFMVQAIEMNPVSVHTAPVKLWTHTARGPMWTWAHQDERGLSAEPCDNPIYFSFGFTFLPGILMDAAVSGDLRNQIYPYVDEYMSNLAAKNGIGIRVVNDCAPKHLHF